MNFTDNRTSISLVKIGQSETKTKKRLKSFATILKYTNTQLPVEFSTRKTYLLDYQHWILWRKDQNDNNDFNSIFICSVAS